MKHAVTAGSPSRLQPYSHYFNLLTNSSFVQEVERLFLPDFLPTDQDILHARFHMNSVSESEAYFEDFKYRLLTLGETSPNVETWSNLEDAHVILYTVSLSDYHYYRPNQDPFKVSHHEQPDAIYTNCSRAICMKP